MSHRKHIVLLLVALFFLNISDAICTWISVYSNMAHEINPIANYLISHGPTVFFGVKISIVTLALCFTFIRLKKPQKKHVSIFTALTGIYVLIVTMGIIAVVLASLAG